MNITRLRRIPQRSDDIYFARFDGSEEMAQYFNLKRVHERVWAFEDVEVHVGDYIAKPSVAGEPCLITFSSYPNHYRKLNEWEIPEYQNG